MFCLTRELTRFSFPFISGKIPLLSKEKLPVVGIGKHLCGVATGT